MCAHHESLLRTVEAYRARLASEAAAGEVSDDLLTTGYAHALELEAERAGYDRALDELLAGDDEQAVAAMVRCRRALANAGAHLRDSLASARRRRAAGRPLRGPSPEAS